MGMDKVASLIPEVCNIKKQHPEYFAGITPSQQQNLSFESTLPNSGVRITINIFNYDTI